MDKQIYKPRIIDQQVEEYLSAFGAVCVEGPKWCGKTWTSAYHSKSEIYIGDPAGNFQNRQLAELSPALVLEGETPRLIDEWQEVPPLWDAWIRRHKRGSSSSPAPPPLTTRGFSTAARDGSPDCGCAPCPCGNPGTPAARCP